MVDERVEATREPGAHGGLALAVLPSGGDVVVVAGQEDVVHVRQERGRVLHVRVHRGHEVSPGLLESGVEGRLLAEVAGERQPAHLERVTVPVPGLAHEWERIVGGAVVYEH